MSGIDRKLWRVCERGARDLMGMQLGGDDDGNTLVFTAEAPESSPSNQNHHGLVQAGLDIPPPKRATPRLAEQRRHRQFRLSPRAI